ncbi:hypothetical protein [Streptomyces soliscabiei]|uniref:hypothetical protein n=1 Tax=Streptomyces soliscabiei TaxID=588897 RepID=UPI0029BB5A8F|nr:hypothetical protein [Streptomyces sp. NY05-11A]MDX2683803.1 hypothetical protein [Streptomyces sp. NY05-11A]
MKTSRSILATAAVAAAAALTATGITYASATSGPAPEIAPAAAAVAPLGGDAGNQSTGNQSKGNEGKGNEGNEGNEEGRIHINERSYSSRPGDCITVVSGLGAKTLNIRNDSRKTVEVFRGAVCDNGAPVATVGPHSQSDGVRVDRTRGIHIEDGVVGSFRVIKRHDKDRD